MCKIFFRTFLNFINITQWFLFVPNSTVVADLVHPKNFDVVPPIITGTTNIKHHTHAITKLHSNETTTQ